MSKIVADRSKIKIVFLSTYPPRECGIATFTKSYTRIFDEFYVNDKTKVIAVSDEKRKYKYSDRVVFDIDQFNAESYVNAANFVNENNFEAVVIEHEYGIFGGENGEYILGFLENVTKPVTISLHSVLPKNVHNEHRYNLTQKILDLSDSVVVMTRNAKDILLNSFRINSEKIKVIPHGVPNVRFDSREKAKSDLGFKDKILLSTFGLLNRGKGIDVAIKSLKDIVKKFPNIMYLIMGATHPDIVKKEGESYRQELQDLVKKCGLQKNVLFINKYLNYNDLVEYLKATDIYISLNLDLHQSFSGSISYALGCGCAIVTTPTVYSKEVLANGRGILVDVNTQVVSSAIESLIKSPDKLQNIQFNAYKYARRMIWPKVVLDYLNIIEEEIFSKPEKWKQKLPDFNVLPPLDYLDKITDDFGIVQHAIGSKPDYKYGYSLDDQVRAMIVCVKYLKLSDNPNVLKMLKKYLNYIELAVDKNHAIHNFIDKNKKYDDKFASDDCLARSFWALSYLIKSSYIPESLMKKAKKIIGYYVDRLTYKFTRSIAYNILGYYYLRNKKEVIRLANILLERYNESSDDSGWNWFEGYLSYANAIIPYSLLKAYKLTKNRQLLQIALKTTEFLDKTCHRKGFPSAIGQEGWYYKNQKKAIYDQQPLEAADMVLLYNELYFLTKEEKYHQKALEWMGWYFGNNINGEIIFSSSTKGVYDGMIRNGVNKNQGAESIVTYLMAYLSFRKGL